jgi:hypothetical protein
MPGKCVGCGDTVPLSYVRKFKVSGGQFHSALLCDMCLTLLWAGELRYSEKEDKWYRVSMLETSDDPSSQDDQSDPAHGTQNLLDHL